MQYDGAGRPLGKKSSFLVTDLEPKGVRASCHLCIPFLIKRKAGLLICLRVILMGWPETQQERKNVLDFTCLPRTGRVLIAVPKGKWRTVHTCTRTTFCCLEESCYPKDVTVHEGCVSSLHTQCHGGPLETFLSSNFRPSGLSPHIKGAEKCIHI